VPLRDVASVGRTVLGPNAVVIDFARDTAFGRRIVPAAALLVVAPDASGRRPPARRGAPPRKSGAGQAVGACAWARPQVSG
jgi:hypothetical protein